MNISEAYLVHGSSPMRAYFRASTTQTLPIALQTLHLHQGSQHPFFAVWQGKKERKPSRKCTCSWPCMRDFLIKNFLPLGFAVSIVWMLVWPWPGEKVEQWKVQQIPIN